MVTMTMTMTARLKLKGLDGRAPPGVEPAAQCNPTQGNLPSKGYIKGILLKSFLK